MADPDAPPPLDLLLARRDWVRRFARVLARDDWAADDLAQDAWVAAVERTPRHAEAPAGWFRRVMTRRAMDLTRAARRRAAHETAASRPDVSSDAADVVDVVAAAEVHRRVVEAVVALPEPYRTTVLLRFFEDLPPREVAARLGVPVETVRARVRRAVERLRGQLDEEHEGRRADWLGALLVPGGGPRSAAGGAVGRASMTRWIVGLVVAAGAAAVVWIAAPGPEGDPSGDPEVGAAALAAEGDAEKPSGSRPRAAAPRADAERASDGDATAKDAATVEGSAAAPATAAVAREFTVAVVTRSGAPVQGARVRLDPAEMDAEPEGVTGADGTWKSSVVGPVRSATVLDEGADGRAWRPVRRDVRVSRTADRVEIVVDRAVWIRGEVLREDGAPFAGAQVLALESGLRVAAAYSDGTGAFALAVPSLGTYDVVFMGWSTERFPEADRNTPQGRVRTVIDRWGPSDAEAPRVVAPAAGIRLTARAVHETDSLRVRVVGPDGRPVAGIPLSVDRGINPNEPVREPSVTDAEGRCVIEDVPCRRVGLVVARRDPDRRPWEDVGCAAPTGPVLVRPGGGEVLLVLSRGVRVRGRVEVPAAVRRRDPAQAGRAMVGVILEGTQIAHALVGADDRFDFLVPGDGRGPCTVKAHLVDAEGVSWADEAWLRRPPPDELVLRLAAEPSVRPAAAVAPAPVAPK